MGKKLVVPGADFSTNGIKGTFLENIPLVIGKAWEGTPGTKTSPSVAADTNTRASQGAFVDISAIAPNFTNLTLKAKAGYKFACYFGNTNVPNTSDASLVNWGYTNSGNSINLDISSCSYCIIMVAANNNATLTSTDWDTYIEES